jgi:hypothetical protein
MAGKEGDKNAVPNAEFTITRSVADFTETGVEAESMI